MDDIAGNSRICFSVITEIELFSWKSAIVHGLTLITDNTTDFVGIEKLRLLNPFDPQ